MRFCVKLEKSFEKSMSYLRRRTRAKTSRSLERGSSRQKRTLIGQSGFSIRQKAFVSVDIGSPCSVLRLRKPVVSVSVRFRTLSRYALTSDRKVNGVTGSFVSVAFARSLRSILMLSRLLNLVNPNQERSLPL